MILGGEENTNHRDPRDRSPKNWDTAGEKGGKQQGNGPPSMKEFRAKKKVRNDGPPAWVWLGPKNNLTMRSGGVGWYTSISIKWVVR